MDGTPHLLTDVKFSERRRGYDPEEVDNFLERVSNAVAQLQDKLREATARAEEADARVADAQRAQAAAEAELSRAGTDSHTLASSAPAPARDPEFEAERASRILLMAQKTADATIDDANATAQQTVSEARAKAADLVSDAEADADKKLTAAQREADELVEQRRAVVVRDVKELEELKTTVQSDIDVLGQHVDEQRARIRRGVEALALVLDDPDGLHVDPPPEVHAGSVDDVLAESDADVDLSEADDSDTEGVVAAEADNADGDDNADEDEIIIPDESAGREDDVVVLNEGIDVSGVDLTGAPEPARAPGGIFGSQSAFSPPADAPSARASGVPQASGDIDLASQELFAAADRDDRSGPPTQSFSPFGESDDPLGVPDDEADKAMRAFFEADFETDTPEQKSRFGFRR
jgi:DivIVA domain-containing protein